MKKNEPGCRCCGRGYRIDAERDVQPDTLQFNPSYPPVTTDDATLNLSSIAALGAGSAAVGLDTERRRLLVQRSNGEVWTLDPIGNAPEILWATTSGAAGRELIWVKYHHSWGYASALSEFETGDTAGTRRVFSLDANGDYVNGPYEVPDSSTFKEFDHCVDSSGNLYHWGGSAFIDPPDNTTRRYHYYKNNAEHAYFERVEDVMAGTFTGVVGAPGTLFHDGTNLYAFGANVDIGVDPFPTDGTGFYQMSVGNSNAGLVLSFEDITVDQVEDPTTMEIAFISTSSASWDATRGLFDYVTGFLGGGMKRLDIDLGVNRSMGGTADFNCFWVIPG
jgi:hypothetical protein